MKPTPKEVYEQIKSHNLYKVVRGESCVFSTPEKINENMLPTDHNELLANALYPLAKDYNAVFISRELDLAIRVAASADALGLYCAIQCFYMQILSEDAGESPFRIDRTELPRYLGARYNAHSSTLQNLKLSPSDLQDKAYRLTVSRMKILMRDHGVDFGVPSALRTPDI